MIKYDITAADEGHTHHQFMFFFRDRCGDDAGTSVFTYDKETIKFHAGDEGDVTINIKDIPKYILALSKAYTYHTGEEI